MPAVVTYYKNMHCSLPLLAGQAPAISLKYHPIQEACVAVYTLFSGAWWQVSWGLVGFNLAGDRMRDIRLNNSAQAGGSGACNEGNSASRRSAGMVLDWIASS